jgi:hypothetical protein
MKAGQTYRARLEVSQFCDLATRQEQSRASLWLKLRCPDSSGKWAWGAWSKEISLPPTVFAYLWQGASTQAPTLREIRSDDGSRVAVLDLILEVPAKYKTCWKTYERRNRELAHLASNLLILLALLSDCRLICGENLTTLKTEGRGRGVRGRFRNWRNNTTVRGELWRVLKYKCHLLGMRARQVEPRGTTHTCPHCGNPAKTYLSPAASDRKKALLK